MVLAHREGRVGHEKTLGSKNFRQLCLYSAMYFFCTSLICLNWILYLHKLMVKKWCENLMIDNILLCVFSWRKSSLEKENHLIPSDDGILQLKCSKRSKLPDVWLPSCHLKMHKKCGPSKWQRPTPRKIGMSPKTRVAKLGRIVGLQPFTGRVGRRRKRRWRGVASTPSIHPPSSTCPNLLSTPFFFKCVTLFIFFN